MNARLGGSCHAAIGGHAERVGERLRLRGLVGRADDGRLLRTEAEGSPEYPEALGELVAQRLLDQGAAALLADG